MYEPHTAYLERSPTTLSLAPYATRLVIISLTFPIGNRKLLRLEEDDKVWNSLIMDEYVNKAR